MILLMFWGPYSVFLNLNGCCFIVLYITALVEQVMSLSGGCSAVVSVTVPTEKAMSLTGAALW